MSFSINTLSTDLIQHTATIALHRVVDGKPENIHITMPFHEGQQTTGATAEAQVKARARKLLQEALAAL